MTKSRGVLIVLVIAAALWALSIASWQAGTVGDTLGPAGVAKVTDDSNAGTSPVATACVAIIAVTGLLSAMLGRIGRFVVLAIAAIAALGYGITALSALATPGATSWPIVAAVAAGLAVIGIVTVAVASAKWTNSNRYARTAEANGEEFDSAATWDALSRGEDVEDVEDDPDADGADDESDNDSK